MVKLWTRLKLGKAKHVRIQAGSCEALAQKYKHNMYLVPSSEAIFTKHEDHWMYHVPRQLDMNAWLQ